MAVLEHPEETAGLGTVVYALSKSVSPYLASSSPRQDDSVL